MTTGSPVDKASFRYLAIALGLSRYFAAKVSAVGVIFFPIILTCSSPSARSRQAGGWLRKDLVSRPAERSTHQLTAFRTQSTAGLGWPQAPFVPSLLRPRRTP